MPRGQKHLVKCRCILPQFMKLKDPLLHQFVVFSIIGDDDKVITSFAQCPNCGIVHKVIDLSRSEIVPGREHLVSLKTIDDIRTSVSPQVAHVLDAHAVDMSTWEAVQFIIENEKWGDTVTLGSDTVDGTMQGKYIRILGPSLFKVDVFTREEYATDDTGQRS